MPDGFEVFADPEHLMRVIENLNRNAIQALTQFGPSSGRPPAIRHAAALVEGAAMIEVSDTGPGFPAHLARRIFEPFHLVHAQRAARALASRIASPTSLIATAAQSRWRRASPTISTAARAFKIRLSHCGRLEGAGS